MQNENNNNSQSKTSENEQFSANDIEADDTLMSETEMDDVEFDETSEFETILLQLKSEIAAKDEVIKSSADKETRLLAEMENLRRRTEKEKTDSRIYGITNFARDIIAVSDNLERALSSALEIKNASTEENLNADSNGNNLKALIEGIELTLQSMNSCLTKHDIKRLEPIGVKFDPNLHQAVFEIADCELPKGYVGQVVQVGYQIGERILRPAMVGVSSNLTAQNIEKCENEDN